MGVIGAAGVWIVPVDPLPLVYVIVLPLADSPLMYVVLMFCPAESPVALVALPTVMLDRADAPVPPLATGRIPFTPGVMFAVPSNDGADVEPRSVWIVRPVASSVALAALPVMLSPSMTNLVSGPHALSL